MNTTGHEEWIVNPARPLPATAGAAAGGEVHVHFHAPVYGGASGMNEVADQVRLALLRRGRGLVNVGLA